MRKTLTVDESDLWIFEHLEGVAKTQRRTLNALILLILEDYVHNNTDKHQDVARIAQDSGREPLPRVNVSRPVADAPRPVAEEPRPTVEEALRCRGLHPDQDFSPSPLPSSTAPTRKPVLSPKQERIIALRADIREMVGADGKWSIHALKSGGVLVEWHLGAKSPVEHDYCICRTFEEIDNLVGERGTRPGKLPTEFVALVVERAAELSLS